MTSINREENTDDGIASVLQSADVHERQYSLPSVDPSVAHANIGGWAWPTTTKLSSPAAASSSPSPSLTVGAAAAATSSTTTTTTATPVVTSSSTRPINQSSTLAVAAVPLTVLPIPSIPVVVSSSTSPSCQFGNIVPLPFSFPSSPPPTAPFPPPSFSFPSALFALPPPSSAPSATSSSSWPPPKLEDRPFVSTKLHDSLVENGNGSSPHQGARDAQQLVDLMTSVGWLQPHDEEQSTRINMEYVVPVLREAYATWLAIVAGARPAVMDAHPTSAIAPSPVASQPVMVGVTSRGLAPNVAAAFSPMSMSHDISSLSSTQAVKPSPLTSELQSLLDALPSTSITGSVSPLPINMSATTYGLTSLSSSSSVSTSTSPPVPPSNSGRMDYAALESAGMDMDLFTDGMLAYQQVVEQRLAAAAASGSATGRSWRLDRTTLRMLFMLLTVNGDNHGISLYYPKYILSACGIDSDVVYDMM
jgi:hypothetical protein